MKAVWLSVGTALLFSQAAVAGHLTHSQRTQQNDITQTQPSQPSQHSQTSQPSRNLAQQLSDNLQQSGYSDVKVMPGSFIVRAQDPQGNPIEMIVTPTSIAEVDVGRWSGNPGNGTIRRSTHLTEVHSRPRLRRDELEICRHQCSKQ